MAPADPFDAEHRGRVLGILTADVGRGILARVQSLGLMENVAVPATSGSDALFVGPGGALVRAAPDGAGWRQIVARSDTATVLVISLGEPSLISADADAMIGEDGFSVPAAVDEIVSGQGAGKYVRAPELAAALLLLMRLLDGLPLLPPTDTDIPAAGSLFRNGDANGCTLTHLYPKA